jgi:hypothetical protein
MKWRSPSRGFYVGIILLALLVGAVELLLARLIRSNSDITSHVAKNNTTISRPWIIHGEDHMLAQISIHATWGLEHLLTARRAFNQTDFFARTSDNSSSAGSVSPLTSPEQVLSQSFPLNWWKPCLLSERILQNIQNNHDVDSVVRVTVVGGSLSSWCPNSCQRYSDVLQAQLLDDAKMHKELHHPNDKDIDDDEAPFLLSHFEVVNMAQGGSTSVDNGFLLEQFLQGDFVGVQILVWEFSVNDRVPWQMWNAPVEEQIAVETQRLKFWLNRVESLFAAHNESVPPIILLYPWEYGVGVKAGSELLEHGLASVTLDHHQRLLDGFHNRPGWNIQVIHLGAAINRTAFLRDRNVLVADQHHPSCWGSQLIADAIQYAIYTSLAENCPTSAYDGTTIEGTTSQGTTNVTTISSHGATITPNAPSKIPLVPGRQGLHQLLLDDAINTQVHLRSLSRWVPQLASNASDLHASITMLNNSLFKIDKPGREEPTMELLYADKVSTTRKDRKWSFVIPTCKDDNRQNATSWLEVGLNEPELVWIGLSLKQPPSVQLTVTLNASPIQPVTMAPTIPGNWIVVDTFQSWIFLPQALPGWKAERPLGNLTLGLCCQHSYPVYLNHIVGVLVSDSDEST